MNTDSARILIIDDNEDILTMTKIMLQMKGYAISIKMNTIEIEEFIKEMLPDLIIMDMLLSGADGREVCSSLKNNSALAHIPILMISAHPNARKDCLRSGADYFLEKPFDMQELYRTVEKSLSM